MTLGQNHDNTQFTRNLCVKQEFPIFLYEKKYGPDMNTQNGLTDRWTDSQGDSCLSSKTLFLGDLKYFVF